MSDQWAPPVPAGYNDTNRAFLQAFMARGTLTFSEAQKILAQIKSIADGEEVDPESIRMDDLGNYITMAREALEPLDYDIVNTRHQVRKGERVWVFYNAHSDLPTQMATTRNAEEVAYFRRLLHCMFDEHNTPRMEVMAVDEGQALSVSRPARSRESAANGQADGGEASAERGLKHSEVLSLLSGLVEEGWLEKSRSGFYSLSPRSLVELGSWLKEAFNDHDVDPDETWQNIKMCISCKEIITYGQRCTTQDCNTRLHDICKEGYWRTQRAKVCPKCETAWDGTHFVGERAVTSRNGYQRSKGRRGGRGRSNAVAEENEDEEMED